MRLITMRNRRGEGWRVGSSIKGVSRLSVPALAFCFQAAFAGPAESVDSLARRVLPASAASFTYALIPPDSGRDVFEISATGGKAVIRGNTTSSIAMGLGYYL